MASPTIQEGDTVVFDVNGEKMSFITLKPKTKVKVGKTYVSAEPLIGAPWGALFTLAPEGRALERMKHEPSKEWDTKEATRTNDKLVDDNTNQTLTKEDIDALKAAGAGGAEIVAALASASATFDTKNEFSQQKYKKRKAKKYVIVATARRPSAATVATAYFTKQPSRIGHLRPDALGLLLHMANVCPGGRILVLERCGGLVTGAVAERLGGRGEVCATYVAPRPPSIDAVRVFNFLPEVRAAVRQASLLDLLVARREQLRVESEAAAATEGAAGEAAGPAEDGAAPMEVAPAVEEPQQDAGAAAADEADGAAEAAPAAEAGAPPPAARGPPFSGCIIAASPLHPSTALKAIFPLLAPSASFAVSSLHLQPLAEAMNALKAGGLAVGMTVQEPWYREQQVLPGRTHPTMVMNHGGGYLLSGTVTLAGTQLALAEAAAAPAAAAS